MATDVGKIFEKHLEGSFNQLKASHLLGWHRFPDTGAAGGVIIQAQPSDYLLGTPGNLSFLEAKASEKHTKLQKSMIRPAQRGAIHFYRGLLGIAYYIAFWDVQGSRIELWDGLTALSSARSKQPLLTWESVSTGTRLDEARVANLLAGALNLRPAAELLAIYEESNQ